MNRLLLIAVAAAALTALYYARRAEKLQDQRDALLSGGLKSQPIPAPAYRVRLPLAAVDAQRGDGE